MTHSDNPIRLGNQDHLGRAAAVRALHRLLSDPTTDTPLVVGVYGGWGTGKTSVMQLLEQMLTSREQERVQGVPAGTRPPVEVLSLWFDSWKYARQELSLWRALLIAVVDALRRRLADFPDLADRKEELERRLDEQVDSLYRSLSVTESHGLKVNWGNVVPFAGDLALRVITGGLWDQIRAAAGIEGRLDVLSAFFTGRKAKEAGLDKTLESSDFDKAVKLIERVQSQRYRAHVQSLEQFQKAFQEILKAFGIGDPIAGKPPRRLFVFVDDLDRCLPEDAVGAIEAIKLFLDLPGCVFVLGMDREVVEQGIVARYKDLPTGAEQAFDPRQYLDKVIQIPFNLPPLSPEQIRAYLDHLCGAPGYALVEACRDLIVDAAPANPRALKRIVNVHQLLCYLDDLDGADQSSTVQDRAKKLAKVALLQICYDAAYRAVLREKVGLYQLQEIQAKRASGTGVSRDLLENPGLVRLLEAEPKFSSEKDAGEYLTLARFTAPPPPDSSAGDSAAKGGKPPLEPPKR